MLSRGPRVNDRQGEVAGCNCLLQADDFLRCRERAEEAPSDNSLYPCCFMRNSPNLSVVQRFCFASLRLISTVMASALLLVCPVSGAVSIAEALNCEELIWDGWRNCGVTREGTHDGVAAVEFLESGSRVGTTVCGPGTVSFWWWACSINKSSSLVFKVDEVLRAYPSTDDCTKWVQVAVEIPAGQQSDRQFPIAPAPREHVAAGRAFGHLKRLDRFFRH